ncbi:MAG: hypothetical protein CME06_15450 [Gemmatimonadetes bacterium]|nr:hypothetical protein [Gemmatimonadota bacterium]
MEWLERLAEAPGGAAMGALALASLLEAGLFPTGADFLLILVIAGRPDEWLLATAVVIAASVAGSALGYWIGRGAGRPLIRRVLPTRTRLWLERVYQHNDALAVAVGGLLPFVPFKHVSLTAGFFDLYFVRFLAVATISRGIRFALIGYASSRYQEQVRSALIDHGLTLVATIVVVALVVELIRRRLVPREGASCAAESA